MAAVAPLMGTATNAFSLERAAGALNVSRQAVCQFSLTGHLTGHEATRVTQRIRQQSIFDTKSIKLGHMFHRTISRKSFFPHRTLSGSRSLPPDNGGGGLGGGGNGGGRSWAGGGGDGSHEPEDASNRSSHTNLWVKYLALLDSNPIPTKSVTSMIINMAGDLFCQIAIEKHAIGTLDAKRLGISALLGLALVGPTLHFWYSSLGSIVTAQGTKGAALRLLLDQFVFSPIFITVFFAALLTLEGRPQELVPKLKQDWSTTVKTNWKIWIPFQFLNFRLVPPPLQVAAANVIALAWNVYLSFASHTTVESVLAP